MTTLHPSIPVPLFREQEPSPQNKENVSAKILTRNEALAKRLPPKIDPLTRTKAVKRLNAEQEAIKESVKEALLQAIRLSTNYLRETTGKALTVRESGTIAKHIQAAIQIKNLLKGSALFYDKNLAIFLESSFEKEIFAMHGIKTIAKLCSTTRDNMTLLEGSLALGGMKMPIFVKALYYGEL